MKNRDTKKSFLFPLGLLVIIWALVGSFSWIINVKKGETSELMANITAQSSRKNEIKTLAKKLLDLNDKIEKTDSFILLPGQEELVKFIEKIEFMGKTAEVLLTINSIEAEAKSPDAPAKTYEDLNLKLDVVGSFKQVFHFMSLIENLPYHVSIKQVGLNGNMEREEKVEKSVWSGDFIFKVSKLVSS